MVTNAHYVGAWERGLGMILKITKKKKMAESFTEYNIMEFGFKILNKHVVATC